MKRKKRIDTRPLNVRVKSKPYEFINGKKVYLSQKLKMKMSIRFPKKDNENDGSGNT